MINLFSFEKNYKNVFLFHSRANILLHFSGVSPSKPRVEIRPSYVDATEYSPIEIQCHAQSHSPVVYTWSRVDGVELSPDVQDVDGWLRFNQIHRSDIADYQCIARNEYGQDSSTVHVNVRESSDRPYPHPNVPTIVIEPPNFSGRPGESVVLYCKNVINVYATLIWTKEGLTRLPAHIDVREGVLTIQRATIEDTGRYICTSSPVQPSQPDVTNTVDVVISNDHGHRPHPPSIKSITDLYTVLQGSDFSLPCEATGNPHPTVVWQKIHEDSLGPNVQQTGNILRILNANLDNRGIYQCTATSGDISAEVNTVIEIERKCWG